MAYQHLKWNKQGNYWVILSSKNVCWWLSRVQRPRGQQSERFEFQHLWDPLILLSSVHGGYSSFSPARVAQWWACRNHDLVVVSSIHGWGDFSFRRIFDSHLCRSMWKSSRWLWKEKLCQYWCEKARKHICVTDRHDMTLAVKVALNPNTTNQPYSSFNKSFTKYT